MVYGLALLVSGAGTVAAQHAVPPEPAPDAGLPALGAWIARWLPVVGATSYSTVQETGDFLAHASDSVAAARLDRCTLVLEQRSASTVHGATIETRRTISVPLDQVDTGLVYPKISRAGMLLGRPQVMVTGRLVVPLRNRFRSRFITIASQEPRDSLAHEHLVPFLFAMVPATRGAAAIRRAAALCN